MPLKGRPAVPGFHIQTGNGTCWPFPVCQTLRVRSSAALAMDGTLTDLANSDYGVPNAAVGTGWAIFKRNVGETAGYEMLSASSTLATGAGYWLKSYQPTRSVAVLRMRNGTSPTPLRLALGDHPEAPVRPAPGPGAVTTCPRWGRSDGATTRRRRA